MNRFLPAVLLILGAAQVQAADDNGFYAGIGSGFMRMETDLVSNGLLPGYGDPIESTDFNKTSLGLKLFAGFRFLRYAGIEVGYFEIFDNDQSYCFIVPDPDNPGSSICGRELIPGDFKDELWEVEIPLDGYTVAAVGFLPLNDTFEVFAKAGGVYTDIDATAHEPVLGNVIPYDPSAFPRSPNPPIERNIKSSGWDGMLAFGLNINSPDNRFTVRSELEWFNITEIDEPWLASLNIIYNF